MRRVPFRLLLGLGALYLALHLALGSSPVQRRVLAELRSVLSNFGLELEIESIEFSAFVPRIYLNRVKITATASSPIRLREPIAVDKIKVQFQPLALIYRELLIDEFSLYHPRVSLPDLDKTKQQVEAFLEKNKKKALKGSQFTVSLRTFGLVDALVFLESKEPAAVVASRSFTFILKNTARSQKNIRVESSNVDLKWKSELFQLKDVEIDVDLALGSARINKAVLKGERLALSVRGTTGLPSEQKPFPENFNVLYDVDIGLEWLGKLKSLGFPKSAGRVASSGSIKRRGLGIVGEGDLRYDGLNIDDIGIGSGGLQWTSDGKVATCKKVKLKFSDGDFESDNLQVQLTSPFPVSGDLRFTGLSLGSLLRNLDSKEVVQMRADGTVKVHGTFDSPFLLQGDVNASYSNLILLKDSKQGVVAENQIAHFPKGDVKGTLRFDLQKMAFDAEVGLLGGKAKGDGFVGFDRRYRIKMKSEGVSLTELKKIANLSLAGTANLSAEVEIENDVGRIAATFDVSDAEVASVNLGAIRGDLYYSNELLSFENLLISSLEPIRGNGRVDFRGKGTEYRFEARLPRCEMGAVEKALSKIGKGVRFPKGGEIFGRLSLEGTDDEESLEFQAEGQARSFEWYGEKWASAGFQMSYKDGKFVFPKLMLSKPTGGVDLKAEFNDQGAQLGYRAFGLVLEDLDFLKGIALSGELAGQGKVTLDSKTRIQSVAGDLKLTKSAYRGTTLGDSSIRAEVSPKGVTSFSGKVFGEQFVGQFNLQSDTKEPHSLNARFTNWNVLPLLSLGLKKSLSSMTDVVVSGDLNLVGDITDWRSLRGEGLAQSLKLGFKSSPVVAEEPVKLVFSDSGIRVSKTVLSGQESRATFDADFIPGKKVQANLDGTVDLSMLQPFIPGLQYGAGKAVIGVRWSGVPEKFDMLGRLNLKEGTIRIAGLSDEVRGVEAELALTQDKIAIQKLVGILGTGNLNINGEVVINRFEEFSPNVGIQADNVTMRFTDSFSARLGGAFTIRGKEAPYTMGGKCEVLEANLTSFEQKPKEAAVGSEDPLLKFDIQCQARDQVFVNTNVMQAEFKGDFKVVGTDSQLGLLGAADGIRGVLIFRDTRFKMNLASVKFESATSIFPRFTVGGDASVREQRGSPPLEYEVRLLVAGTPQEYKIRLTSSPPLLEGDIISLLMLGVTGRGQEGNFADLGSALAGQLPLQSRLKNELGVNVRVRSQGGAAAQSTSALPQPGTGPNASSAPSVQIQKEITDKTRISYSNTIEAAPSSEFRIEQMLDENFTINATVERNNQSGTSVQRSQAYGLDFRYRIQFE